MHSYSNYHVLITKSVSYSRNFQQQDAELRMFLQRSFRSFFISNHFSFIKGYPNPKQHILSTMPKRKKNSNSRNKNARLSRVVFLGTSSAQPIPLKRNVSSLMIQVNTPFLLHQTRNFHNNLSPNFHPQTPTRHQQVT